jgi:hypothetical protein
MISFIDEHCGVFGVEPICRVLPIAPSTYYETVAKRLDVDRLSIRARSDVALKIEIRRVFEANFRVYGVRKVWRQLNHGRLRCGPLHCRSAHEIDGASGHNPRQADPHDIFGQDGSTPTRPREPSVQGSRAEQALGERFHICGHLGRFHLCRIRHRRLRPPHRRLAREPNGMRVLSSTLWSKPFTTDVPFIVAASSITRTEAFNTCR